MDYTKATDHQIRAIINHDGSCPKHLLEGAIEEAVRRDLYHSLFYRLLTSYFKSYQYAERVTKLAIDDIKQLLYIEAYAALKFFKEGKNSFISFWMKFIYRKFGMMSRDAGMDKRVIWDYTVEMKCNEHGEFMIPHTSGQNVEKEVIAKITVEEIMSKLTTRQQVIVKLLSEGYTKVEIGKYLGVSREVVRRNVTKVKDILGVAI